VEAPWQYTTLPGAYRCTAHFELDMSWLQVTIGGQHYVIHSTQLWNEGDLLLPMRVIQDIIYHGPEHGLVFQTIEFNDGSFEGPERIPF